MGRFIVLLGLVSAATSLAQVDRAALVGTVRDSSGRVVPNVTIVVTYPATGLRRETVSSEAGVFRISSLPIGACTLEVSKSGFRPILEEKVALSTGETRTMDFALDISAVESTVEVRAAAEGLAQSNAQYGDVTEATQLDKMPVNGRNWTSLMALIPGAIDPAGGDQKGVRFFGAGGDDNNFRVDGVDATSIRNQTMRMASRLLISEDAIAEFRVNSSLYTAESGGTPGAQVEVVSKSGSNQFHGFAFEYLRNNSFDARSPFDPATLPAFHLNQFGATVGGPVVHDRTFFFLSYEGLTQSRNQTLIGFVPTAVYRQRALTASPALQPVLEAYPQANAATSNPDIGQWNGHGAQTQDEHVGLLRADHRFNDRLSSYFRFTRNSDSIGAPLSDSSDAAGLSNRSVNAPVSGVIELLYVTPRATNEFRFGANWVPWDSVNDRRLPLAVQVSGFSTIQSSTARLTHSLSESIIDNFSLLSGRHTWKIGAEIRRVVISNYYTLDGTVSYANLADFAANKANSANGMTENPARTMAKVQYFGYLQDEWKIKPNLTANFGLRYEFFNEFKERYHRNIAFDLQSCGGYCPYGGPFGYPDNNNLAPRVSLAWSPSRFHRKTVIRAGAGLYYGDAQLGDQLLPSNNDAPRFSFVSATAPNLAYPIAIDKSQTVAAAPIAGLLHRHNEQYQQWGAQIQQLLPSGISVQAGYMGSQNIHVFSRTYLNLIDPATGKRPLANFDQIDARADYGVSSYHGLLVSVQRTARTGLFLKANYTWAHAINDGSAGGGDATYAQIISCRSCDKADSQYDARHSFSSSVNYPLPFFRNRRLGGWTLSGIGTMRSGLPLTVSVSRKSTDLPDGNSNSQRPNLIPMVSTSPVAGPGIDQWINPAAFSVPDKGTWGNAGRNIIRGPQLRQMDAALSKDTRLTERTSLVFRAEVFNVFNHPELGSPNLNLSAGPSFGRITTLSNQTPTGVGGCRSIQLALRLTF